MRIKVIKGAGRAWRPFRFPPRYSVVAEQNPAAEADPAALQRAIAEGFQEGLERGYQEGLEQGREAGQREGFAQGREAGYREGYAQGSAEGQTRFEEAAQTLSQMVAQFERFQKDFDQARRKELLELVRKVAKQVIRIELTLHPTQLLALAEEALATMPGDLGEVRILLNPEECARIKDIAPERSAEWRLVPDERLPLGECRVVTAHAEADIGCQQRLDSCMEALAEHLGVDENEQLEAES